MQNPSVKTQGVPNVSLCHRFKKMPFMHPIFIVQSKADKHGSCFTSEGSK